MTAKQEFRPATRIVGDEAGEVLTSGIHIPVDASVDMTDEAFTWVYGERQHDFAAAPKPRRGRHVREATASSPSEALPQISE